MDQGRQMATKREILQPLYKDQKQSISELIDSEAVQWKERVIGEWLDEETASEIQP